MNEKPPLISVVIPTHNAAYFLTAALESVWGQVGVRNIDAQGNDLASEVLVIDDGSTDQTESLVRRFAEQEGPTIRYVYQPQRGPQHARNHGLRLAQGELVAFLDADDIWVAEKLQLQTKFLYSKNVDLVIGYSRLLKSDASPWLFLNLGSALFRRSVFDMVGTFDATLPYSDDLDWFMRARELHIPIHVHQDVVLYHRRHSDNLTNDRRTKNHYNLRMLKQSLDRRRQQGLPTIARFSDYADSSSAPKTERPETEK